nr:MAG TPA: hypothetical protein [Caudoviricetes sp.]
MPESIAIIGNVPEPSNKLPSVIEITPFNLQSRINVI